MPTIDLARVTYALQVETHGVCSLDAEIYIRIGVNNPVLLAWMDHLGIGKLAILTSTNPGGQVLPDHENHERWTDLVGVMNQNRLDFDLVVSRPGCGDQESETQMAVPNMDKQHAATIAARFGQVAFVWCQLTWLTSPGVTKRACVPELVWVTP